MHRVVPPQRTRSKCPNEALPDVTVARFMDGGEMRLSAPASSTSPASRQFPSPDRKSPAWPIDERVFAVRELDSRHVYRTLVMRDHPVHIIDIGVTGVGDLHVLHYLRMRFLEWWPRCLMR